MYKHTQAEGHCGRQLGNTLGVRHITHVHLLSLRLWHVHAYLSIIFICSSSDMAVKLFIMFVNLLMYMSLIDLNW